MKLKFINSLDLNKKSKATVHKSGKISFNSVFSKKANLTNEKSFSIAINEDNIKDKNLYLILNESRVDGSFRLYKAGDYFHLIAKSLFDFLEIDYSGKNIIYDISEEIVNKQKLYKLKKR